MSLADQLKAKQLKKADQEGPGQPRPALGPPKLSLMDELKQRAQKKKQMAEAVEN